MLKTIAVILVMGGCLGPRSDPCHVGVRQAALLDPLPVGGSSLRLSELRRPTYEYAMLRALPDTGKRDSPMWA
jgi:hypothetical protein